MLFLSLFLWHVTLQKAPSKWSVAPWLRHTVQQPKLFKIISILHIHNSGLLEGTHTQKNIPVSLSQSPVSTQYLAPPVPPSCQIPQPWLLLLSYRFSSCFPLFSPILYPKSQRAGLITWGPSLEWGGGLSGRRTPGDNIRTPFIKWGRDKLGTPRVNLFCPVIPHKCDKDPPWLISLFFPGTSAFPTWHLWYIATTLIHRGLQQITELGLLLWGKVLLLSAPAAYSNQPRTLGNCLVMLLISVQSRGAGPATKSQCKLEWVHGISPACPA